MKKLLAAFVLFASSAVSVRPAVVSQTDVAQARAVAIFAPAPDYPYEARRQHIVGRGIVILEVDRTSGNVTHAVMQESTGSVLLDDNTLTAFRRWRFQPGTIKMVRIPINYTMRGEVITTVHVDAKPMDKVLAPFLGKGTVINGPMPQYPRSVPWKEKHGEGLYELHVGANGDALNAKVLKSSGDAVFDQITVAALQNWRLRRGPLTIELPLSFHLTSTKYTIGIPKHP
jgi:TonB family protein